MKKIFLISGKAQHGKDTVAELLSKKLPGSSLIIHNADPLKFIAKNYMGWDGKKNEEGRTLLQWLGTEKVRQELGWSLFWNKFVCSCMKILEDKYDYFLVPDTRFHDECYYTKAIFGNRVITIRVIRENFENDLTEEQRNHLSETSLDDFYFDYYIGAESGIDKLEAAVDSLINALNDEQIL